MTLNNKSKQQNWPSFDETELSLEFFRGLNSREKDIVLTNAAKVHEEQLAKFFAVTSANWVVIAGCTIVAMGSDKMKLNEEDISGIEEQAGSICFVYTRPEGQEGDFLLAEEREGVNMKLRENSEL
ncbi:hypothetical protein GF354_04705 [Candidatus Peregrinibacteria bacterium]|nr:hypothetical protein [Candidatus Peregrinibacteria bacterium]